MELTVERRSDVVVVKPAGRIDHQSSPAFRDALAPHLENCWAGSERVLLELSALGYISSAGLRVLLIATERIRPAGGQLALAEPREGVREILELARFIMIIPVHATVGEDSARCRPAPSATLDPCGSGSGARADRCRWPLPPNRCSAT